MMVLHENNNNNDVYANPVNFVFVLGARSWDKEVKVWEPLPNRLIKQQQEVDSCSIFYIFFILYKTSTCEDLPKLFSHESFILECNTGFWYQGF